MVIWVTIRDLMLIVSEKVSDRMSSDKFNVTLSRTGLVPSSVTTLASTALVISMADMLLPFMSLTAP